MMLLATGLFLGHSRGELRSFAHAAHARYNDAQSHTQAHGHTLTYPHQSCTRVHGHTPHTSTPVTCRFVSSSHPQQYGQILLSFLGAEFSIPEDDWFKKRRDMTGFRSEIYAFMDVARAKDIHEMGFDETQVDGISTCNLWVRVTNTLDQVTQLHVLIQVKCICDAFPPSIDRDKAAGMRQGPDRWHGRRDCEPCRHPVFAWTGDCRQNPTVPPRPRP